MDAPSTDRRKRTQLPFVLFVIGTGLLDIAMFGILLNGWAGLAFLQWIMFFVQASLLGQILFAILLGGLLGTYWLKGIVLGSFLATCWIGCVLVGISMSNMGFSVVDNQGAHWFVFAIPALVFGGATPLLVVRYLFGWQLSKEPTDGMSRRNFGIEELFLITAAIASILFLCRVPQIAMEFPAMTLFLPVAAYIGVLALFGLLMTIPTLFVSFRIKNRWRRWLGYAAIMAVWYVVIAILAFWFGGMAGLGYTLAFVGIILVLLVGLKSLRMSGYELAHNTAQIDCLSEEEKERSWAMERKLHRRWTFGVLGFSALASLSLTAFISSNTSDDIANFEFQKSMQEQGGSIDVNGRKVVELKFGPDTTDQSLQDFHSLGDVQTISLAHTQVTDAGLKFLSKFPRLLSLDLSHTKITDAGVIELQRLSHLSHLSLAYTQVTMPRLANAKSLMDCESLDLSGLHITDEQLALIQNYKSIQWSRSLFLRDNQLTDAGLKELFVKWGGCDTLDLSGNPLDGSCLSELRNVKVLILENLPLTDVDLDAVITTTGKFSGPTTKMVLSNTKLTEAILGSVGPGIELGDGGITEDRLALCTVQGLTLLKLKGKSFTGRCFETWHPRIYHLDLQGSGVTDATMKFFSNITGLVQVNLADTQITDAALPYLSKCMHLNLSNTRISFDGLHGASFQNANTIQVAVGQFSVEEVRALKRKLPVVVGKSDAMQW